MNNKLYSIAAKMISLCGLMVLLVAGAYSASPDKKPHIVFVDDWGYADVRFRNPAIKSPNFDMLTKTGLLN